MTHPISISSVFDDGKINSSTPADLPQQSVTNQLIDLLHNGFYLVFLIRNHYVPSHPQDFREQVLNFLNCFEQQAKRLQFSADEIHDAKYAFCALIDETIAIQQDVAYINLQNMWLINPLQLSLFSSQLAGYQFFERLEQLRSQGKQRLATLEIFHYCLLLGFQGKYRLESIENLNYLVARLGDEIDFLKGKKVTFSPFTTIPDQVSHILHRELPFFWILVFLLLFTILAFTGFHWALSKQDQQMLTPYHHVISTPQEQVHIMIHLP